MCFEPDGAGCVHPVGDRPSLYALVIYLPPPLGKFLDDLRLELVPGCNPHAHVSVLPPRPLPLAPESGISESRRIVAGFPPFDVQLGRIEVFPQTDVIYISVEAGADQLRRMHDALNQGTLAFQEPFAYHPHITLAQELQPGQTEPLLKLAEQRWQEFPGDRTFHAERAVFVRNIHGRVWVDLADGPLHGVQVG
jgi:hypothetical protein